MTKCEFEKKEINYLGVIVSNGKIQMDPKKLKGVTVIDLTNEDSSSDDEEL